MRCDRPASASRRPCSGSATRWRRKCGSGPRRCSAWTAFLAVATSRRGRRPIGRPAPRSRGSRFGGRASPQMPRAGTPSFGRSTPRRSHAERIDDPPWLDGRDRPSVCSETPWVANRHRSPPRRMRRVIGAGMLRVFMGRRLGPTSADPDPRPFWLAFSCVSSRGRARSSPYRRASVRPNAYRPVAALARCWTN